MIEIEAKLLGRTIEEEFWMGDSAEICDRKRKTRYRPWYHVSIDIGPGLYASVQYRRLEMIPGLISYDIENVMY
jgi:hypothetical protein